MNTQSKPERDRWDQSSSRTLGYFPRFALVTLAVLLLLVLWWSLTGGESVSEKQGIQTLSATGSVDQPADQQPGENERPQTGTGGDQPSDPPEDQK